MANAIDVLEVLLIGEGGSKAGKETEPEKRKSFARFKLGESSNRLNTNRKIITLGEEELVGNMTTSSSLGATDRNSPFVHHQ